MNRKSKFGAILALSVAAWAFSSDAAAQISTDKSKASKSDKARLIEKKREQFKKPRQKAGLRKELGKETLSPGKLEGILKEKERRRDEGKKKLSREALTRLRR